MFRKIQDWIVKFRKNPNTDFEFSLLDMARQRKLKTLHWIPLTHHDLKDLGLMICLVKKRKIQFQILSDLKIQSWINLKKRILSIVTY